MQIIKHKSKNDLYFLFTRWGRIGDAGQYQLTPYSTLDECRKEFLKVFREKTGNAWKDTDQFEIKPKKYALIKLSDRQKYKHSNVPIDFKRLQSEQTHPPSKLQSSVFKNFLKTLINHQAIRTNIDKTQETKVEQIFKIARSHEDERLFKSNLDNHCLLWHGTSVCNLISILNRGLLVEP
ncbi:unnamed protein product, partial [Rotaria magnacalcarata]